MRAVPKAAVIAAQPYQTLHGPALVLQFEFDAERFLFQRLPFAEGVVPEAYHRLLLDSLVEFSEKPRVFSHHRAIPCKTAPLENVSQAVGSLSGAYFSYLHCTPSDHHPAMGSIELNRASHRKELDVRMSLYDREHRPLSSAILSGPSGIHLSLGGDRAAGGEHLWEPPSFSEGILDDVVRDGEFLCGPMISVGGSFAQCAASPLPAEGGVPLEVPSWTILRMVADFCQKYMVVHGNALHRRSPVQTGVWRIASYHSVTHSPLQHNEQIQIVAAPPKYFGTYTLAPWEHRIGLPMIQGKECVAMRLDMRQGGVRMISGVYYLTPVVPLG